MATTNTTKSALVYPLYKDAVVGANNCIVKESLTVDEGVGTLVGDATGSADFNSDGFKSSDSSGLAGINFAGVSGMDNIKYGFTCYFEVERSVFSNTSDSVLQYLFNLQQTAGLRRLIQLDEDNATGIRFRSNAPSGNKDTFFKGGNRYPGSHVPIWISGGWGHIDIYVDYIWKLSYDVDITDTTLAEFILPGRGIAAARSLKDERIRNVAIWLRAMVVPTTPNLVVGIFGDSFAENGAYDKTGQTSAITTATADGKTGAAYDGSTVAFDDGFYPTIHAGLARKGFRVHGNRILHWAETGSGITAVNGTSSDGIPDRIDVAVTSAYPILDYAVIWHGYNDLVVPITIDATYVAAYQTEIDKLTAIGTTVIVCNLPWNNYANSNASQARVTAFNTALESLTGCTLVDVFTATGGFNNTAYEADNVHPSASGHAIAGKKVAEAILAT